MFPRFPLLVVEVAGNRWSAMMLSNNESVWSQASSFMGTSSVGNGCRDTPLVGGHLGWRSPLAYDQGTPLWGMVVMAGDGITRRDTAKDRRILLAFPLPC